MVVAMGSELASLASRICPSGWMRILSLTVNLLTRFLDQPIKEADCGYQVPVERLPVDGRLGRQEGRARRQQDSLQTGVAGGGWSNGLGPLYIFAWGP